MRWLPRETSAGITWIDDPVTGEVQAVQARLSRSIGLPSPLPDILGLALRVDTPQGPADIEFASTGSGLPLRFALLPRRRPSGGDYGILLPYRGELGGVLLRARPLGPELPAGGAALEQSLRDATWWLELAHATPRGPWHPFALMELRSDGTGDGDIRFDAGSRLILGARIYPWVRALRQPSYDAVQRADE